MLTRRRPRQAVTLLLDGSETRIAGGVGGATGAVARRCGAEVTLSRAIPADALPSGAAASVTLALQRAAEVAYDDVCRQLAYHVSNDRVSFDVVVLAYSLLTYVHIGNTLGPAAANAAAGVKDAVGSGSSLPPRNERLVAAALATVFSEFRSEGLWEAGQPIFITRSTGADVGNAFVFSPDLLASLIEVMPASAFLPHLPSISAHLAWLEDHVIEEVLPSGALLRGWRSNHLPPEGGPLGWCTAQALRCIARLRSLSRQLIITDVLGALGGRVASPPDPSAWERLLDSDLSAEEGGVEGMPRGHASGADEAAGDAAGAPPTLKATIERRMLAPLTALSSSDPLQARLLEVPANLVHSRPAPGTFAHAHPLLSACTLRTRAPLHHPTTQRCFDSTDTHVSIRALEAACSYSAILFGPPGTAKTTVVDAIARNLGWGFVTVDTSTFLKDGLSNVAARISDVFELLGSLENVSRRARELPRPRTNATPISRRGDPGTHTPVTFAAQVVVLFDEVEEFALDRSIPTLTMESRMLTTAMLTKLADLRNSRRVAFFIATNRLAQAGASLLPAFTHSRHRSIARLAAHSPRASRPQLDAAVTRPGRFDMQLFVGTPNLKARLERFRGRLALDPLNEATRRAAVAAFERVLLRRWRNEAQFLTYLETERLAADAAAAAATAVAGRGGGEGGEGVAAMSDLEAGLEASFEALLESQAATMTVRGSVREEFLASQGLSRV